MDPKIIDSLLLNIGDEMTVVIPGLCYKLREDQVFETGFNRLDEKGWKDCSTFQGAFCGARWNGNSPENEMTVIKIRMSHPVHMRETLKNYIEFSPSSIQSITITNKTEGNPVEKVIHALTLQKQIVKN